MNMLHHQPRLWLQGSPRSLAARRMVHTSRSRRACTAPAHAPRFQALCMALGLSDDGANSPCAQPQPQKLRLPPAGGVHKAQQQRCKLAAAAAAVAAAAVEHGVATPPRLAEQPRRRQPFAVGRPPRPVPAVWRTQHAAQQAQQAAWTTHSCDSVTSPNVGSGDCR